MQNYHKHDYYSNTIIADSPVSPEAYAQRAVEVGHKIISSCNHGWQGRYIEHYEQAKKYDLKFLFAVEAYFVKDRVAKDATNAHIVLLAKNENGRRAINRILSEAALTGFYYRPRVDMGLVLSLPSEDVWLTSACVAGIWKYDDYESIVDTLSAYFKRNFYLEVQNHNTDRQKELNSLILDLSNKKGIALIAGLDSHYIYPEQSKDRDDFLASKHLVYEDEAGWYMDYPDDATVVQRFEEQGILNKHQIIEAMDNTNVFLDVEEYTSCVFNTDLKLPTIYPGKTQEEKNQIFIDLIAERWEEEKKNVPVEKHAHYEEEIKKECDVIVETGMADYFLLDEAVVRKAVENDGQITLSGRGCFTKDALVHTLTGLKHIDKVVPGDFVINGAGGMAEVSNVASYDIQEEMVKITHIYGSDKHDPMICTKDHLIMIMRNEERIWEQAQNLMKGDYVCYPKIEFKNNVPEKIDLADYNSNNFPYDDKYIYERRNTIPAYEYSPSSLARRYNISKASFEKFANMRNNVFTRKKHILEQFYNDTPFKSQEEYSDYISSKKIVRISRFIEVDELFNTFLGLMYGDGYTQTRDDLTIALAINGTTKAGNGEVFYKIADRIGIPVSKNQSKTRNLIQLYVHSKCLREFFGKEVFVSLKGRNKQFNPKWLYQDKKNLEALLKGLIDADGCRCEKKRTSFDNTSLSLIGAFKLLCNATNKNPVSLHKRLAHSDPRGYAAKESYKARIQLVAETVVKPYERSIQDQDYWYLPVKKVEVLPAQKTTVFDIEVPNGESYLINNMIVHNSAVSNYTAKLLGLTTVDRISAPVKLFPERFITKERILEAGTIPDIDINSGNVEAFFEAQAEIVGQIHTYPMLAYGKLKPKAAWKMYARSQNIDFDVANAISDQISKYEDAVKHASEGEEINDSLFIDKKYYETYKESYKYRDTVSDFKIHPCASLIHVDNILEDIGIVKIKDHMCSIMDGLWAEQYRFLKNDFLKVSVVELIYGVYKRLGMEPHSFPELVRLCEGNQKVWDVYKNAWSVGINQIEQTNTSGRAAKYAPTNISEMSAFIAAIRPGFQSNYKQFEAREPFSYGVPSLDALIQTEEFPQSYMLYQENAMQVLAYAGIPISKTYEIIKNIAKKRVEKVKAYKDTFLSGMKKRLMEAEKIGAKEAKKTAEMTWQIIEDSSHYSFNCCLAGDTKIYGHSSTIEEMFKNGERGITLSMFDDGRLKFNYVVDIRQAGEQTVYYVHTKSGSKIRCTINHKFPTPDGTLTLGELLKPGLRKIFVRQDGRVEPMIDEVLPVGYVERTMTYDVEMAGPAHNFVVESGIVTSNSHSYCMAGDSMYGAYLKSHYPLEFYETFLRLMDRDGDKDRLNLAIEEARKAFKIQFPPMRFGQDNRAIVADKENNSIYSSLTSIKGFTKRINKDIWDLAQKKDYKDFLDFLVIAENSGKLTSLFEKLIKIGYFEAFGHNKRLLLFYKEFTEGKLRFQRSHKDATKEKRREELQKYLDSLPNERLSFAEQLQAEHEILGYVQSTYPISKKYAHVKSVDIKYSPKVLAYCLNNGKVAMLKVNTELFQMNPISEGDIIHILSSIQKPAYRRIADKKYEKKYGETDWWILKYEKVSQDEFNALVDEKA